MLDGILGRGFSSKCKSSIKLIKTRIDEIRRRRNATQKFLKKDIADLLANGLDIYAYGRAEGLLIELNLSSCYNLVEEFCGSIARHLSVMQKQRVCPEECREAVSSLMFAAARFADLPELRVLRQMFTERYGDSLEIFKNQEFVEKLASNPPAKDSKLQLMRDIAKESSIKWDSKAFEQKLSNPSAPAQDRLKRHASLQERHITVNKPRSSKDDSALIRDTQDILPRAGWLPTVDGFKLHGREETVLKRDKEDASSHGRQELTNDRYKMSNGKLETTTTPGKDNRDVLPRGKREAANDEITPRNAREVTVMKRENKEVSSRGKHRYIIDEQQPHNVVVENTVVQRERHDVPSHGRKEYIQGLCKHHRDRREKTLMKRDNQDASSSGRRDLSDEGGEAIQKRDYWDVLSHKRHELTTDGYKQHNSRKASVVRETDNQHTCHGRIDEADDGYMLHCGRENAVHRRVHQADSYQVKQEYADVPYAGGNRHNGRPGHAGFREKASEDEIIKPRHNSMLPPPYVRPNDGKHSSRDATSDSKKVVLDAPAFDRDLNDRSERIHKEPNQERQEFGPPRVHYHRHKNSHHHHEDDLGGDKEPKLKSVRKHLKPAPGHESIANNNEGDEVLKSNLSDRRRGDARCLHHALYDSRPPKDEEEKMMDKLLMHYSKKPSKFEEIRVRAGLNPPHGQHDVSRLNMDSAYPPASSLSLPKETVTPRDSRRGPARATSFQSDMKQVGHVHPMLPDCDDLEARFASLRAR